MNPLVLLLPLVILLTWARLIRPGSNTLQGSVILVERVTLLGRLRMHGVPALAALLLGGWFVASGDLAPWTLAIPVVSNILLIALPVNYTLTEVGIRLGYTGFRRWTEFTGVRRAPGGARLVGLQRKPGMHIWLAGDRRDDEFLQFLRQTVKNAYKGTTTVIPFPVERTGVSRAAEPAPDEEPLYRAEG
jgi:hypothetical protein